jgi:cytoskeletal protein RodZ
MSFDNLDTEDDVSSDIEEEGGTPEEASNRTFLIVAGVFGAIVVLSLICLVLFIVFKVVPGNKNNSKEATAAAQRNLDIMKGVTETAKARSWTATPTEKPSPLPATPTPIITNTPVIKPSSTPTSPNAATMEALYKMATETKAALGKASPTPTPKSTLGETGFADQVGVPALLGLAAVLIVVIFLARRLRTANS